MSIDFLDRVGLTLPRAYLLADIFKRFCIGDLHSVGWGVGPMSIGDLNKIRNGNGGGEFWYNFNSILIEHTDWLLKPYD